MLPYVIGWQDESGKTNDVLKHLLIADHLDPKGTPFYSKIV
jgi:hypothetical protein